MQLASTGTMDHLCPVGLDLNVVLILHIYQAKFALMRNRTAHQRVHANMPAASCCHLHWLLDTLRQLKSIRMNRPHFCVVSFLKTPFMPPGCAASCAADVMIATLSTRYVRFTCSFYSKGCASWSEPAADCSTPDFGTCPRQILLEGHSFKGALVDVSKCVQCAANRLESDTFVSARNAPAGSRLMPARLLGPRSYSKAVMRVPGLSPRQQIFAPCAVPVRAFDHRCRHLAPLRHSVIRFCAARLLRCNGVAGARRLVELPELPLARCAFELRPAARRRACRTETP